MFKWKSLYFVIPLSFILGIYWSFKGIEKLKRIKSTSNKGTIRLLVKKDMLPKGLVERFSAATKINVEVFNAETDTELIKQALGSALKYDMIIYPSYFMNFLKKANVFKEIKYEDEDYQSISSDFLNLDFDKNNVYSLPIFWNMRTFIYKLKAFKKALPLSLYDLMSETKMSGQVSLINSKNEIYSLMKRQELLANTWFQTDQIEKITHSIKQYLKKVSLKNIKYEEFKDSKFIVSQIGLTQAYYIVDKDKDIGLYKPKEKMTFWVNSVSVFKGFESDAIASDFISYLLSQKAQLELAAGMKVAVVNKDLNKSILPYYLKPNFIRKINLNDYIMIDDHKSFESVWLKSFQNSLKH